jgi:hypothetical protein
MAGACRTAAPNPNQPPQDFARVFSELYPQRRPLYLLPPNECGVPKLVCSTLRPTQLPYTELYDLPAAAQFVADFISYEPLEDPAVGPACWDWWGWPVVLQVIQLHH